MREHFAKLFGVEYSLDNPNDLLAYSYDASGKEGKARLVVFPASEEDVRQVMLYAKRTNIPVVPRGLGTNPLGMVVPENAIVIDMKRFDRIHTVNLKENWVLVDAGVVLGDLQALLNKHERTFPISPRSARTATIGALLAMNQMDRRSQMHGRIKDHVLSMELIDGTGKHYPNGNKAFIGMEGTGAIILRAKIRVFPQENIVTTDLFAFEKLPEVLAAANEKKEDLTVLSLEYLNPHLSELVHLPSKHHLLVEYASEKGAYVNEEQQARLWEKRDGAWDAATQAGHPYIEDCSATGEKIFDILSWCDDIDLPVAAHIGMGIIHPFFARETREDFYQLLQTVRADHAGQFGYGLVKRRFVPERFKNAFIKLKDEYDFEDMINRGKVHDYV